MSMLVGPMTRHSSHPTFVHEYPASQAALARLKPIDPRVAERCLEIYLNGIERPTVSTNSPTPPNSAPASNATWNSAGPVDALSYLSTRDFCRRLSAGLPGCSGVAMEFDRVLMLAAKSAKLDNVLAFPIERS